jgi:hypothetical protein
MVAWQRIALGGHHAGKTVPVAVIDTNLPVDVDGDHAPRRRRAQGAETDRCRRSVRRMRVADQSTEDRSWTLPVWSHLMLDRLASSEG